jgi:hypothetical protein
MDNQALANLYKSVVEEHLGFVAHIQDDGSVRFGSPDSGSFYIGNYAEKGDPEFFQVVYPNFLSPDTFGGSREAFLFYANQINNSTKCTKAFVLDGDEGEPQMWIVVEHFAGAVDQAPDPAFLGQIIARIYQSIMVAVREVRSIAELCAMGQGDGTEA